MTDNKGKILTQLQKITYSKTFAKTSTNIKLLEFLVNESLAGTELKEVTIGVEMFGKKYDPIKNDNKVRVYVYHLRKKLDQYYTEEAGENEIIFVIEKGQYSVEFVNHEEEDISFFNSKRGVYWTRIMATSLLFVLVAYFIYFQPNKNMFWAENLKNIFPTTVLIGDHYTLDSPIETGNKGIIRDFSINSDQDYQSFIKNNPDKVSAITPSTFSYITKMGAYCSKDISGFFNGKGVAFDLMLNSEWDKSKVNEENTVFIGQAKTMRFLKNILEEHYPFYQFKNNVLIRTDPQTGKQITFTDITGEEMVDYTIVAKIQGPAGNCHKLFLSDHDGGVINSLKYFTNPDSVQAFYSRHKIRDKDFIALFKVSGWERTGYNMEFEFIDFNE